VILGCGLPESATGYNVTRQSAVRAGIPVSAAAQTVSRFCASGFF
jgi:acetyl-CoA C-acetyltransferase